MSPTIDAAFNFDGPYFNNNSMTLSNAINNNILQNFEINNSMQTIENVIQLFLGGSNFEDRIAALESWYANASAACNGNKDYITSVSLGAGGLVFTKDRLTFTQGLLSNCATSVSTTTIDTTECP